MAYIGRSSNTLAVRETYFFTATGGETSLSGADDNGNTLAFTDGNYVDVYLNGVLLVKDTDYDVDTTNTIDNLSALTASDIVEIVVYDIFAITDTLSKSNGGTVGGNVTFDGTATFNGSVNGIDVYDAATSSTGFFSLPSGTTAQRPGSPANGYIRYNTDDDVIEEYRDGAWEILSNVFSATGGTVTEAGGYKYHTFTSSGTFTVLSGSSSVDVLLVAGGASGGAGAGSGSNGGGGAGGLIDTTKSVVAGAYTITIGAGGAARPLSPATKGANGGNTTGFGETAIGGGGGGHRNDEDGLSGGSGGGAGNTGDNSGTGGAGTSGQGYAGGNEAGESSQYPAGGGGGAAGSGQTPSNGNDNGGDGGAGINWKSLGTFYAGGGGGGTHVSGSAALGGSGVGGNGGVGSGTVATAGATNRGGGGGGNGQSEGGSGAGGSGIVIIRYPI